ncbi:hypothetical protein PTE01_12290 [Pseudoalteromonas tetraodonis GFC]|uniref:Cell surface protein n=1 Tax=Pseudoalteromonas tetraodonis GFC TaxID=1315271 RepID=A0AA37S6J8_9GAMM|nr:hypothetical protein [Pseudoalteromonas tetraodonis]ATD04858.1 hypothetical protein PTET_b0142 [Pseudoalteromonas tetraodonis]GEN38119.1 hypothetical protein PTE01_12290 [Pseudoalteromonas tetraodonis GFC]GLQ04185.1 hypothetical protein GCM10007914_30660 [Pseudoalteromonas tetraodonis GFC]
MKPLLSCLLFCFALFYSASSAAYNEAMCILIKQEMQQHSNNKASRKYRNAARDFEKNCSDPQAARTLPVPKPKPQPVIEQSTPEVVKSQQTEPTLQSTFPDAATEQSATGPQNNVIEKSATQTIEQAKKNAPVASTTTAPDESQVNVTAAAEQSSASEKNAQPGKIPASELSNTEENTQPEVKKATVEPAQTAVPITIKASEQTAVIASSMPKGANIISLVLPSVALLLIVVITVVVLMRLRNIKQNKQTADTGIPLQMSPSHDNDQTHSVVTEPMVTGSVLQNPAVESKGKEPDSSRVNTVKIKPEPNTAEFEAAAKATLERIKNATEFAEPQVRDFDPEAKQTKIQRNPINQPIKKVQQEAPIKPSHSAPEPIVPHQPQADFHPAKTQRSSLSSTTEHDFKEPEVRTFDPDAPLPTKKIKVMPEQVKVAPEEPSKPDNSPQSSNPFANLSLDESWDPNSPQKPKIEEKKRAPKSQALIDAEERAKNMQTKE